jgi:geranylgeranyl diphosphate synthase type II
MSSDTDRFEQRLRVPREARAQLTAYQKLSRKAVLACLPDKEPRQHLYDLLRVYPSRGGKALRPALCLAAGCAFGGSTDDLLSCAVALELLHTAFLVHDDIQDESPRRRGGPALHAQYGVPLAMTAGDALATLAMGELVRGVEPLGRDLASSVLLEFDLMVRQTIEGQAIELGWQQDDVIDLTDDDYVRMAAKKTAWYTGVGPLRLGALIGSDGRADVEWALRLGYHIGVMFQVNDDLDGLAEVDHTEKAGDLYEGKRTLMLIHLLGEVAGGDRRRLRAFLSRSRGRREQDDVEWVRDQMHDKGSVEHAQATMRGHAGAAMWEADVAFADLPDSPDKTLLLSIVPLLLEFTG